MTELQRYLAEEIAEDCADGLISDLLTDPWVRESAGE
jgi:hypothetical protein